MSVQTIKDAIASVLRDRFTPEELEIEQFYRPLPYLEPKNRVIIWSYGFAQKRIGAGRAVPPYGILEVTGRMMTHLMVYAQGEGEASVIEGAHVLDRMVNSILELYQSLPTLNLRADTGMSKILVFSDEMSVDTVPPDIDNIPALYQAVITSSYREEVNA